MVWLREVLAVPFGYLMSLLYLFTGNYLLSIIILTVVIRLALLPFAVKQQKNTSKQVRLQPKIKKIQEKFKGDQRKINEETQALYSREGFSVTQGGCLPLAVQFPVMIGLFGVIYTPLSNVLRIADASVTALKTAFTEYATANSIKVVENQIEITILEHFDTFMADKSDYVVSAVKMLSDSDIAAIDKFIAHFQLFGIELFRVPDKSSLSVLWLFPIFSGITAMMTAVFMFLKQRQQNPEIAKNPTMGCMAFMSPVMSVVFAFMFPVGVSFYWIISNIISFVQTLALNFIYNPKKVIAQVMVEETIVRRARENNVKKRIQLQR